MTKTETQVKLDENIPKDEVSTREGGGGKSLSYLETWYVIDRLNQVLGQGNWGYQTSKLDKVFEGKTGQWNYQEKKEVDVFATSYIATVALFAVIEGKTVIFTEVGYGDGTDKKNPGKAHELATKEAVSDGLKRAAKNLGRSMGLALYDKTQEYVGKASSANASKTGGVSTNTVGNKQTKEEAKPVLGIGYVATSSILNTETRSVSKPTKDLITAAFKTLEAQGKITKETFKEKYQKGVGISKLTEDQLTGVLNNVKQDYPHLGL